MIRSHEAARSLFLIAAFTVLVFTPPPAGAGDHLDAYRNLAHTDRGHALLTIARDAMRGIAESPAESLAFPPPPAALYVTLARGTATRACVGQDPPRGGDLREAVESLAAEVRTGDRRRPPVREDELASLRLVLAFAGPAEPVASPHEVDPGREGLLVEGPRGRVAFLPGEARTVSWALREARRIGVIEGPLASVRCSRFPVVTLSEAAPAAAPEDPDVSP